MRVIILALLAASAWGQTTVSDTLRVPTSNSTFSGEIEISAPDMVFNSTSYVQWKQTYTITAGVLSVVLIPNDTATPAGTVYTVKFHPSNGAPDWVETWSVPTSASPVSHRTVKVVASVEPYRIAALPMAQLRATPAYIGKCVSSTDGIVFVPAECGTGSGTAATVAVGTVTTGDAGTSAAVTNAGTTSAAVLNFTIPRGATGATGAAGAAGATGPAGADGAPGADGSDADVTGDAGIITTGTGPKVFSVDDTQFLAYSVDSGEPTGVGAVGEMYIRTSNHSLYLGTGTGWSLVTATASVTPSSTNGDIYMTNDAGAAAWGGISVSSGLTKAFAGSTITLALDSAVVPTKAGDNVWTGKRIVTPTETQVLTASSTITASQLAQISAASEITVTSTPTIAAGTDGEYVTLANVGNYAITLKHQGGSGLFLAGAQDYAVQPKSPIQLVYLASIGGWMQQGGGSVTQAVKRTIGSMFGTTIGSYYGATIGSLYYL